ncbi:hypothetical protein [Botryobacter ruber]|uniref:hypothetical protein n=1 Tax=Botryobacter ruber TaxID=2171629 RepID=UPI000E0C5F8B|nr:hypothetical protein [Botryobacter ruber]
MKTMEIPAQRFLISEDALPALDAKHQTISSTISLLFFKALVAVKDVLHKYKKLVLVLPQQEHYPISILQGFLYFSIHIHKKCVIVDGLSEEQPAPGTLYITLSEADLADLIKTARCQGYTIGEELDVLSLGDTPIKRYLGISVITTGVNSLVEGVGFPDAYGCRQEWVREPFTIIRRDSF